MFFSDEVAAALMVKFDDILNTMGSEVSCVGCRRSVETMLQKLSSSGDPALEPLVITEDRVISVSQDHIATPQALANLFCNQLYRLKTAYIDTVSGPKNRKKGGGSNLRCNAHSLGLGSKKMVSFGHWSNTWKCMERECQEECVLIHFDLLRDTIGKNLFILKAGAGPARRWYVYFAVRGCWTGTTCHQASNDF